MKEVTLYTGEEVYRPIWEEESALLEVELGCSWGKCLFCDFIKDKFHLFPLEEIEIKAQLLAPHAEGRKRIFLLGENPFILHTKKLLAIFGYIHQYMPWIEEISMYSRVDNILEKSPEELALLKKEGLVHLHIGIESGNEEVLRRMNKGVTAEQGRIACKRLRQAGITFTVTAIPGLGGVELSEAHARETAEMLNEIKPSGIWLIGLKVWPNTPLEEMCQAGRFEPVSLWQRLWETREILSRLELKDCKFVDSTVLDTYTLTGELPKDQEKLLYWADRLLRQADIRN